MIALRSFFVVPITQTTLNPPLNPKVRNAKVVLAGQARCSGLANIRVVWSPLKGSFKGSVRALYQGVRA